MVGKDANYKYMAYVGNEAAFIKYQLENVKTAIRFSTTLISQA